MNILQAHILARAKGGTLIPVKCDANDLPYLTRYRWEIMPKQDGRMCAYRREQKTNGKGRRLIQMSRDLLRPLDQQVIDHKNRDPLDNRRSNLRVCSQSENLRNTKMVAHNSTGHKHVSKRGDHFRVRVKVNYVSIHRTAHTLEEAVNLAEQLRKQFHGEFANNGRAA